MAGSNPNPKPQNDLQARGMTVAACSLGTGVRVKQDDSGGNPVSLHLSPKEARSLAAALVVAVQRIQSSEVGVKTVSSLFVRGLRIDQIAVELGLTSNEVREELISRGLLILE